MVAVLLAATCVPAGRLQVSSPIRADPDVLVGWRNCESRDPLELGLVRHWLSVREKIDEGIALPDAANARRSIGHVNEADLGHRNVRFSDAIASTGHCMLSQSMCSTQFRKFVQGYTKSAVAGCPASGKWAVLASESEQFRVGLWPTRRPASCGSFGSSHSDMALDFNGIIRVEACLTGATGEELGDDSTDIAARTPRH